MSSPAPSRRSDMPENEANTTTVTTPIDLAPSATVLADLIRRVPDADLSRPTPCAGLALGGLLDHISGFALAFTAAARRTEGPPAQPPDADRLGDDWRVRLPGELAALAAAWADPAAWEGSTEAAGVPLDGTTAALFALDEIVVHGWDLARAAGLAYDPDPVALPVLHHFVDGFVASGRVPPGLWEPPVPVDAGASLLDRTLALTGRDPNWCRPGA
jgi:uncharacterized protein (TIGR03086 family)